MNKKRISHIAISSSLAAVIITLLVIFSLTSEQHKIKNHVLETALMQAEESFNKDIQYRRWNASHGGVYVEINDTVQPNPYLKVPNRDITSRSGKKYTLVNPAWMTRETYEQHKSKNDVRGHITSLNPTNPKNAPDEWETTALHAMTDRESRFFSMDTLDGEKYLRYMRSFVAEKPCLKCHAEQGYKEGDIKGGICISIRLEPISMIEEANIVSSYWNHGIVWFGLMAGLFIWVSMLRTERNKLIESEARWKFALESAGDAVWDWNTITNTIYFSVQWKSMLGYTDTEIGDTLDEWSTRVHPDDLKHCLDKIDQHIRKETPMYSSEHRLRCSDGTYKWVLDRGKVIEWTAEGKPSRMIGVHADISERREIERRIQENEIYLNGILESTDNGILAVDNNGKILKSNSRFAELWNIPTEVLRSGNDQVLIEHAQNQLVNPEEFLSGIRTLYNSELSDFDMLYFKDKRVFERYSTSLKLSTDIVGRVWSFRDVTENKKAFVQLLDSERLLKESQVVSQIGSYVLDISAGIWYGSEVLNEMFGIHESDDHSVAGWVSVIHPDEQKEMSEYFINEVIGKKSRFDKEYRIQTKNSGQILWVHGIGELEFSDKGIPIKMIGTIQNISEKKKTANEIFEKKVQLETLIENLPGYIYRANDESEKPLLLFVSEGIHEISGYSSKELLGATTINFIELIHNDDLESCANITRSCISAKKPFEVEYRIRTKSGKEKWLWERGRGIFSADGRYLYTEGYVVDITDRKTFEKILIDSEKKFRVVWEKSMDAMRLADENGIIIMVNAAYCKLFEKRKEELIGFSIGTVYSRDVEKTEQSYIDNFRNRTVNPNYEGELPMWNGTTIFAEVSHTFLSIPEQPTLLLSVFHDITLRKRTQQELHRERTLLRTVIDNIPDPIYVKDLEGRKLLANIADAKFAGKQTVEEVLGKTDAELYPKDIADHSRYEEETILQSGRSMKNYEGNFLAPTGERRWLIGNKILLKDSQGNSTGILGINHDITDRKNAEEKNRMLAHTIECISEAVTVTDLNDLLIYVNKAFLDTFGYQREEVIGKHVGVLWSKNNPEGKSIQLIEGTNAGGWKGELLNVTKNGYEFTIQLSTSQVKDEKGNIFALVGVAEDITQKKKSERQIIESEKYLRKAEEVATIGNWKLSFTDNTIIVSDGAKNIFGYTGNEISLWDFYKFALRENRQSLIASFRRMIAEKVPLEVEFKIKRTSDGSIRDIFLRSESDPGGTHVFGIIHDVTRQKKMEQLARAREAENRFLAESLLKLSECETEDEVFSIINLSLLAQLPDAITFISRFTDNTDYFKVTTINGLEQSKLSSIISLIGFDPRGLELKVSSIFKTHYNKPILHKFENGITEFLTDAITEAPLRQLKQELDIADVYAIGISQGPFDFGFINIITTNKNNRINPSIVKSLTHQCALALTKIRSLRLVLESEEKYRELVESSPDAIAVYVDGKVVYVNSASIQLMRATTAGELLGRTIFDFVHPDYRAFVAQRMTQSIREGKSLPLAEERFIRMDGTDVDVEVKAIPIQYEKKNGVQLIIRDVTERKRAIEAISASEVFIKDILNSLSESIAVLSENGTILEVNKSWIDFGMCNNNADKLHSLGSNYFEICRRAVRSNNDPYAQQALDGILSVVKREQQFFAMEYPCHSGSEQRWFLLRVSPMTGPRKGVVVSHENISERKKIQLEINELNEHLEEKVEDRTRQLQETNRQLETFSYSVSHDLRSPLRAIDSFSRILFEEEMEHLSENGKRQISLIRGNTLRMSRLIDDLLEFSRTNRSELKRMPFDMSILVRKIINEFTSAEPNRTIETSITILPKIFGDPSLFRQVFVNLIGNALKFSTHRDVTKIEIGGSESETDTTFYIKDNGAGFDMRYAEKLFGVFQRLHTESEYEGTGVGLAIVQRIIQRHGGTIFAKAEIDHGATFTFSIPKQTEQ